MSDPNKVAPVSQHEFNSMRQNIKLLTAQAEHGRVDGQFLLQQLRKLNDVFDRMEEERKRAKQGSRFEALYNVSRILGASLDLQIVLDQVMDAVIQLTGAERGFLMLRDQDGGLEVKAARNLDQQTLDGSQFHYSRTISYEVLDKGEAIVTTNAAEDPRFMGRASIMAQSLRSIMAAPLRARGIVIGVAYVDNRVVSDLFDEADLNALEALAGQAAIAIENARLFEQTDQKLAHTVSQLTELRRIDRQLNETLDPDKAMEITLSWAVTVSHSVIGHLGLVEGDPPIVSVVHHYGTQANGNPPDTLDRTYPLVAEVLDNRKPATGTATVSDQEQQILVLPIMLQNKVFGVAVLHKADTTPFTDEEIDLAGRVVNRAAVTIDNAWLYAKVQAADKAKSEFVGVVAHDLKVPMTSILGYAALTKMIGEEHNSLVERQGEFLDKINDTVKRMEILVSDLADVSRIESGHFYMEATQVSVADVIAEVRDNTFTQMESRGHQFVEKSAAILPDMYVDYYRLVQVLTNLVSNAYKYTPDGGTITLDVGYDFETERIRFTVSDTGIGMRADQVAMLGTKFWRSDDDYTRTQKGTGLGFAITRSLVQLMGSEIEIESEVGKGSSFSFTVATVNEQSFSGDMDGVLEDTRPVD